MTTTATDPNALSLQQRFAREGYVVLPRALPAPLIDRVLAAQRASRRHPLLIFRGQGVVGYERARWNAQGQMVRSIQNPHLLGFAPRLSRSIRELVFSNAIAEALAAATGQAEWVNWQTMLFDRSVGTDLHLDTWFLDTQPRGHLVGAWIALEDIQPTSGPFLIYPRSHELAVSARMAGLDDLSNRTSQLRQALRSAAIEPRILLLRKGDLVLWNSLVAHGSELPVSPQATRKSVTAHFYPLGMNVADPPIARAFSIYDHARPRAVRPGRLHQAATIHPLAYSSLCTLMYLVQLVLRHRSGAGAIRRA